METIKLSRELSSSLKSPTSVEEAADFISLGHRVPKTCPSVGLKSSGIVPSRTLQLKPIPTSTLDAKVREKLKKEWQLSLVEHSEFDQCSIVRFYDLRESVVAWEYFNSALLDGTQVTATFSTTTSARDFDEEGRIVVRVEEHLKLKDLYHIFSTYGGVRNIQDVPNVNVHKVVEFFDLRDAQKATKALNCTGETALHAASVAYLEKTRCKLFLIPPRLPFSMEIPVDEPSCAKTVRPKTLPLCGARKQPVLRPLEDPLKNSLSNRKSVTKENPFAIRSLRTLRDSSSSLASVADQEQYEMKTSFEYQKGISSFFDKRNAPPMTQKQISPFLGANNFQNVEFTNSTENEEFGELSLEDVLPSGLGLYDDEPCSQDIMSPVRFNYSAFSGITEMEQTTQSAFKTPYSSTQLPCNNNELLSMGHQQPLSSAMLSRLTATAPGSVKTPIPAQQQGGQDAMLLAQYIDELQQTNILRQLIQLETLRRWNSLKGVSFNGLVDPPMLFPFTRAEEALRKAEKANRKKNSRMNRRNSAMDIQLEAERRAQQDKMYALDLDRVKAGQDKRTTLMIKNIPNKYTQRMLLTRIEQDFKGTFDFFYLPIDFKNKCNVGYGFINLTKLEYIPPFVEHVHEQKWDKFNSDKVCCVTYARIQGRNALINHFQNSSLMLEESKHQPLLFGPNGDPEPFPTHPTA
eukprot:g1284.t1